VDLHGLVKLALVTSHNIPFYVAIKQWPPKAVEEGVAYGTKTLMAEVVMGIVNKREVEGQRDI